MADFSGLASVMQIHKEELTSSNRVTTKGVKKAQLDLPAQNASNSKVSMKLIQILKDHQDELGEEEQQMLLMQQNGGQTDLIMSNQLLQHPQQVQQVPQMRDHSFKHHQPYDFETRKMPSSNNLLQQSVSNISSSLLTTNSSSLNLSSGINQENNPNNSSSGANSAGNNLLSLPTTFDHHHHHHRKHSNTSNLLGLPTTSGGGGGGSKRNSFLIVIDKLDDIREVSEIHTMSPQAKKGSQSKTNARPKEINNLPEKLLLNIFSYLTPHEILRCALVCKFWRQLSQNPKLWRSLRLRPEYPDAIHIRNMDHFLYLLSHRFNTHLEYIEMPIELITAHVLHELANKCTNLKYMTLDFSAAMQLQDFNDLNAFPVNLKSLTICLSEVIFLEGFMRRIYSFLSSVETLHLIGTLETSNDPDESYETINISKIKAYTPNLKVVNFYGITFIDDNHIESLASGCIQLECLALNFCSRFKGYSLKTLLSRCRKVKCLLLQNTALENDAINQVDWSEQTHLHELDLTSTDLNEQTLSNMLSNLPNLTFLSVAYCDGFTDQVFLHLYKNKKLNSIEALDVSYTVNLNADEVFNFLKTNGHQLRGFTYTGNVKITEQFWISSIKNMQNIEIALMGTPLGWFRKIATRIHVDQIIESFAASCPRLERVEIQWDPETIRFNENSRKYIDHIRLRCSRLKSFVLSDGEYYEMVKANFERAGRHKIVRTTTSYHTSIVSLLKFYPHLLFN